MDDSDQDFVHLCSKLLKRVRKKPAEPRQPQKVEGQSFSQASQGERRRRNNKKDVGSGYKCTPAVSGTQPGCAGPGSGDDGSSGSAPTELRAKDKVLHRMQQFKRPSPQKMMLHDECEPTEQENYSHPHPVPPKQNGPESYSTGLPPVPSDSDEALALRLQRELDREVAEARALDLEDEGLFFCQICHRDLSHMSPEGRTQHINRCLDESEDHPPPPPPPPGVPDCPICGKRFKSQKSRSTHLKRCSSDMGVSPAVLLQALQRQAEETPSAPAANLQTGGTKRKGPPKPGLPARKKPRKEPKALDEDTMVALALSSSLLEQEKEKQREMEAEREIQKQTAASHDSRTPGLMWRPDAGKGRGKRKKGGVPRPPPLLLIQDAEAAMARLQERVSALLLRSRAPSPPTPTRCPSTLPAWSGAAPLWQKSALLNEGPTCTSDFYTPELREFIEPWESAAPSMPSSARIEKPGPTYQPESEQTPVTRPRASILPSSTQMACSTTPPSTPGTGQLPVSSQVLRDLIELAEDGMTLTQRGYTTSAPIKDIQSNSAHLHLSGFVPEDAKEQNDLCVSGFLPETTHTHSEDTHNRGRNTRNHPDDRHQGSHKAVALSRLASDLSSMVNNPQLSDVQLQVDSGEVYFAHSFMVYARCPLLAELVHESGFGVKEEGVSAAQRVLMSDVPGQAVFALLQYLYTGQCSFPASLRPHVLEMASRFDLQELQQICQLHQEDAAAHGDDAEYTNHEQNLTDQTDQAFLELLRSMWNNEEQDEEGMGTDEGRDREESENQCDDPTSGDREIPEEQVNEDELVEIYEFAATQKKKDEEEDSVEEEKNNDGDVELAEDRAFTKLTEPQPTLDRSYNRLFSDSWGIYKEEDPSTLSSTSRQSNRHTSHSPPAHKLSSEPYSRTVLQSSASVIDKLSPSPPPSTPSMPVPGLSPGGEEPGAATLEVQNDCIQPRDENLSLKTKSQRPHILCIPLSPDSPQENKQPELIVLSDSSEEMEVDYAVLSSRSPSPCTKENTQSYTHVKEQLKPKEINPKSKGGGLDASLAGKLPVSEPGGPGSDCESPVNCSPEVSWLIPSTPVQPGRSIRTTSSQTSSSICRTQLFTKGDSSSHSSSLSSPKSDRIQTSTSPLRVPSITGLTHTSISRLKPDRTAPSISSFDVSVSNKPSSRQKRSTDSKLDSPVFAVPSCQTKLSQPGNSSNRLSCLPPSFHIPTYCSTPLHTELHQPPIPPPDSPLHPDSTDPEKRKSTAQEMETTPTTSPEKTVLNSFHLSPLSERSSSSLRAPPGSNKSQCSVEFSSHDTTGNNGDERRDGRLKDKEGQIECDQDIEREQAAESSFQQSFMDEPPIAFNDSWGLDACVENPDCFSLKLEESGGSNQQDQSLERRETAKSSISSLCQPAAFSRQMPSMNSCGGSTKSSLSSTRASDLPSSVQAHVGPSLTLSPPDPITHPAPDINDSLLNSKIWDSWDEDEEEVLPLSQRINPSIQLKTPKSSHNTKRRSLVPITPMPHYSDMDTPELKNKLTRFGVRPLPKRQMILKLKEIHQYTHQLASSDSEDEAPSVDRTAQTKLPPISLKPSVCMPVSRTQTVTFKEPRALTAASPIKHREEEDAEPLSASQGSNTSSTAASEESERSNPELCLSDGDSDSDGGISASQAATRLQDRLLAVRSFILSNPGLHNQILQYQPLVLSQFQQQLKDAGIRLGVAKLADYLDSQCITFTMAKPGHSAPGRRRAKNTGKGVRAAGDSGARRKRGVTAVH